MARSNRKSASTRRSRAKPRPGWTLAELAALAVVSPRTARLWLTEKLLPAVERRGRGTRYTRSHLVALLHVRGQRAEGLGFEKIRASFKDRKAAEIEALVVSRLTPGPVAAALGVVIAPPPPPPATQPIGPRWARVEVALGLELHVRDDVSAEVLELVRRMRALAAVPALA